MVTVALIMLALAMLGAIPTWPHSRGGGYVPGGVLGLLALVLVVMLVAGT